MSIFTQETQWQTLKQGMIRLDKREALSRFEKITAERKADGS